MDTRSAFGKKREKVFAINDNGGRFQPMRVVGRQGPADPSGSLADTGGASGNRRPVRSFQGAAFNLDVCSTLPFGFPAEAPDSTLC
jgi:hypothetical protein